MARMQRIFMIVFFCLGLNAVFSQSPVTRTNCPRSQKQADLWYFGDKAGIDFRTGTAIPDLSDNVMKAYNATAVICDSSGNLLFFTNGNKVWDRNFTLMGNANGLDGDLGATQPCIIIPNPAKSDIFYVFTIDVLLFKDSIYTTLGLRYSTIDMTLRNGMGDASSKNTPLLKSACQKLTAVMSQDKKSVWVIAHAWNSRDFYAYRVSEEGVADSVTSSAGSFHGGGSLDQPNAEGSMKVSPDGKYLALAITGKNMVELFGFNNQTGVISDIGSMVMPNQGVNTFGIEFSPNSRKLYTTQLQRFGSPPTRPSYVYQFDLAGGLMNPVLLDSVAGNLLCFMQLATDGRIYISRTITALLTKDSIDVIYNPNRPGKACNFNRMNNSRNQLFSLDGRKSVYGLPNFIQTYFDLPAFRWDSVCNGDITKFTIPNKANIDSVLWDFGDGGFSRNPEPIHLYTKPGKYMVKLTEKFNGQSFTDSALVTSYALPTVKLGGDTILMYSGSSIILHAGGGYMEYFWSNGSGDSIISVASQGNYSVRVKDFNCCMNSDSVYVKVFEYSAPTAFTPNNDGLNDVFRVIGLYRNISFTMNVFDRWGQQVFTSDNIDKGWDGTIKGKPCEAGSYVWMVKIGFLSEDIIAQGDIVMKGNVMLIR